MMKIKKFAALLLALLLAVSTLAACTVPGGTDEPSKADNSVKEDEGNEEAPTDGEPAEETFKAISYGMGYDASTLDLGMTNDDASITPVSLMIEPLLRTKGSEIVPGIAEKYDVSEDSKIWTFYLRESTFSDGTPVTAETMAYTLKRLINPENALDNMASLADLVGAEAYMNGEGSEEDLGIEVVDEYTLKLSFNFPQYEKNFVSYIYAPVCQALVESCGEAYGAEAENFLGNGPFMLESWTHDAEIVMVKNPAYWNAEEIKLDQITQVAGAVNDTAIDMMATDALDAGLFNNAMYRDSALELPGMTYMTDYPGTQSLHLNSMGKTEETAKWLSNVNFRKALSYGLDRTALVAAIFTNDTPASKAVPDTEMGTDDLFNNEYSYGELNVTADTEKAQEFLALAMDEIGVSDVSEIPAFTMLAFDSEGNVKCLNAIADMWDKNLGIKCELDMEPIMEMIGKAMSRDYDFWKGGNSFSLDYVGLFQLYDSVYGQGSAVSYDNDEEYHELYLNAISAPTWKERKDAEAVLAQYWTDNMMDLMITWENNYYVYRDTIVNVLDGDMFCDFTFADLK